MSDDGSPPHLVTEQESTGELEQLLELASQGELSVLEEFLKAFLEAELVVPDRVQDQALSNAPTYPSPLFALLGVRETDRCIIPCFISAPHLLRWSTQQLKFSRVRGKTLLERVPDDWWLVLNPGSDAAKEFSPWEIQKLREGSSAFPELLRELRMDLSGETSEASAIEVRELRPEEYQRLRNELIALAEKEVTVKAVYAAIQENKSPEEASETLLIGVRLETSARAHHGSGEITEKFQTLVDRHLIGEIQGRVAAAESLSAPALALFDPHKALWERKGFLGSLWARLGL